jgi:hypothetical protein
MDSIVEMAEIFEETKHKISVTIENITISFSKMECLQ